MRKDWLTTSAQYSAAMYFAMPASRSLRSPLSFRRAALTISWCAASTLLAMSAMRKRIAWWSTIFLPKVSRCWAYWTPSSKARIARPQAREATLTRPTSTPSIIW